jgi:hypothetical protein
MLCVDTLFLHTAANEVLFFSIPYLSYRLRSHQSRAYSLRVSDIHTI